MINVYRSTRQIYLQHLNRIDGSRKKIETSEIRYSELKFHQLLYEWTQQGITHLKKYFLVEFYQCTIDDK